MSKDKEYIVDKTIDVTFTEEEKAKMRTKKTPALHGRVPSRQNLFVDRRDPLATRDPSQPERRKNQDRREDKTD